MGCCQCLGGLGDVGRVRELLHRCAELGELGAESESCGSALAVWSLLLLLEDGVGVLSNNQPILGGCETCGCRGSITLLLLSSYSCSCCRCRLYRRQLTHGNSCGRLASNPASPEHIPKSQLLLDRPLPIAISPPNNNTLIVRPRHNLRPPTTSTSGRKSGTYNHHVFRPRAPRITASGPVKISRLHALVQRANEISISLLRFRCQLFGGNDVEVPKAGLDSANEMAVTCQASDFRLCLGIVDADSLIGTTAHNPASVELDTGDALGMADVVLRDSSSMQVPRFGGAISRRGDDSAAVDHDRVHSGMMLLKRGKQRERFDHEPGATHALHWIQELVDDVRGNVRIILRALQGVPVPDLDRLVLTTGDNVTIVESEIEDGLFVRLTQHLDDFTSAELPYYDHSVRAAGDDDVLLLSLVKLEAEHARFMSFQWLPLQPQGIEVPDADRPVAAPTHKSRSGVLDRVDALGVTFVGVIWMGKGEGLELPSVPVPLEPATMLVEKRPADLIAIRNGKLGSQFESWPGLVER